VARRGDFVEFAVLVALLLLAMFGSAALVELVEHADGTIGLDDGKPTPLDFNGQSARLFTEQFLLGVKDHFVSLGFDELVDVEVRRGEGDPLRLAQSGRLVGQALPLIGENLLGAITVGERGTALVAFGEPQFFERFESEAVFGHGQSLVVSR
jgi:hypothetical protein